MVYVVRYNICVHIVDMAKLKYRTEVSLQNKTDPEHYVLELHSRDRAVRAFPNYSKSNIDDIKSALIIKKYIKCVEDVLISSKVG